jgi:hypothetical protein
MFTDAEARIVYIQLKNVLLRSELSWIIPQIQAEIAKGKITSKSIKDISRAQDLTLFETAWQESVRRPSKDQFLTSQAYTAREQLMLLLKAVLEITDINVIRQQIMANLKEVDPQIASAEFASEEADDSSIVLDEKQIEATGNTFIDLARIINQIKSDL